jgi:hypothetical protein
MAYTMYAKVSDIAERLRANADTVYLWIKSGATPPECVEYMGKRYSQRRREMAIVKQIIVVGVVLAAAIVFYALHGFAEVRASLSLWDILKFEINANDKPNRDDKPQIPVN